jgi:hypothetical protein
MVDSTLLHPVRRGCYGKGPPIAFHAILLKNPDVHWAFGMIRPHAPEIIDKHEVPGSIPGWPTNTKAPQRCGAFSISSSLKVRFGQIPQFFGCKAVLDQFSIRFLVAHDHRTRVDLDDFALYAKLFNCDVIAAPKRTQCLLHPFWTVTLSREVHPMSLELAVSLVSTTVAILALVFTTLLLARQLRQMEHERNALAIMQAIERLTASEIVTVFHRLRNVQERYANDADFEERFPGSQDENDFMTVGAYMETLACLARRGVLDPSLLVDAIGYSIRRRWASVREVVLRRRVLENNPFILENFEWLACYSEWWKEVPRPKGETNYQPDQFPGVTLPV